MDVIWDIWTSWPSQIDINARLSPLTQSDHCSSFRIGITGNPYERASRYESSYDELIVLYESDSDQHARDTERYLAYYYWDYCDNSMNGGKALMGPPYYIYLVRRLNPHPRAVEMPELTPNRLLAIDELGQMDVAEWNQDGGEIRAVSEDRRKAIVDLLQDREVLQARIRELERFIETGPD